MYEKMYEELQILSHDPYHTDPENALAILKHFYGALTALDMTSAAILTFDAILVAAAVNFARDYIATNKVAHFLARAVTVLALLSAGLALWVDRVSYPFWGYVMTKGADTLVFSLEFQKLKGEIARRTLLYQMAWYLSLAAVIVFLFCIFWPSISAFISRLRAKPRSLAATPSATESTAALKGAD